VGYTPELGEVVTVEQHIDEVGGVHPKRRIRVNDVSREEGFFSGELLEGPPIKGGAVFMFGDITDTESDHKKAMLYEWRAKNSHSTRARSSPFTDFEKEPDYKESDFKFDLG
jgi:hypothetical protein